MSSNFLCIHPHDATTNFLEPIGGLFGNNYYRIESDLYTLQSLISGQPPDSKIFLIGHGSTAGFHISPHGSSEEIILNKNLAEELFLENSVFILACRSEQFIRRVDAYKEIIGFGNIISSEEEILADAEMNGGDFRPLTKEDINYFNDQYVLAIRNAIELLLASRINFDELPKYISYFINKSINTILLQKQPKKIEISRLLFEFRNEMTYLKK